MSTINTDILHYYKMFRHQGGIVGHDAECALAKARAYVKLQEAVADGLARVQWSDDDDPDTSWMGERAQEEYASGYLQVLVLCIGRLDLEGNWYTAASLSGISTYGTAEDMTNFEAELALEAFAE